MSISFSIDKECLNTYYMPGTIAVSGKTKMGKALSLPMKSEEKTTNRNKKKKNYSKAGGLATLESAGEF